LKLLLKRIKGTSDRVKLSKDEAKFYLGILEKRLHKTADLELEH